MGLVCDQCGRHLKKGQPGRAALLRDEDHLLDLCYDCSEIVTEGVQAGKLRSQTKK